MSSPERRRVEADGGRVVLALLTRVPARPWRVSRLSEPRYRGYARVPTVLRSEAGYWKNPSTVEFPAVGGTGREGWRRRIYRAARGRLGWPVPESETLKAIAILSADEREVLAIATTSGPIVISVWQSPPEVRPGTVVWDA